MTSVVQEDACEALGTPSSRFLHRGLVAGVNRGRLLWWVSIALRPLDELDLQTYILLSSIE